MQAEDKEQLWELSNSNTESAFIRIIWRSTILVVLKLKGESVQGELRNSKASKKYYYGGTELKGELVEGELKEQ